jgi:hypothetical protein
MCPLVTTARGSELKGKVPAVMRAISFFAHGYARGSREVFLEVVNDLKFIRFYIVSG